MIKSDSHDLNFVVCEYPEWEQVSVWDFSIFFKFSEPRNFCLIATVIFLISITAFSSGQKGFQLAFFATIRNMISLGHGQKQAKIRSGLLILWVLSMVLLAPLYFGDIASKIIIPAAEKRMTEFFDLKKHNYSVINPDNILTDLFNDVVKSLEEVRKPSPGVLTFGNLIRQAVNRTFVDNKVFHSLARNHETIIFGWPITLSLMNRGNIVMTTFTEKDTKKCYVGQKLVKFGDSFHTFLPPGHVEIAKVFANLEHAGIVQRWIYEYQAAFFSDRVQNRGKFKSPTNVMEEREPPENLKLEGKTITIFLLWATCIVVSIQCFVCEMALHLILSLYILILLLSQIRMPNN